jgi:hypothetical protein
MKTLLRGALAVAGAMLLVLASLGTTFLPAVAQTDPFASFTNSPTSQCTHWSAITPTDGVTLTTVPKALWVGGAGNINMIGKDAPAGATGVTWSGIPAGTLLSARPRQVNATLTTATLIVACY